MVGGEDLAAVVAKRHELLAALLSDPMCKPDLVEATEASRSTVDRAVDELREHGLVERSGCAYRATFTGACVYGEFREYRETLSDVCRADPVVGALPADAPLDADVLEGASVEPTESHAVGYPVREALGVVRDADRLKGVCAVVTPQFVAAVHERALAGDLTADLVLTPSVLSTVQQAHGEEFAALRAVDAVTLRRAETEADVAVWCAADGSTSTCVVVVRSDAGTEGVLINDTEPATEWADDMIEQYRKEATVLDGSEP